MKQMNHKTGHANGHTARLALTMVVVLSLILPAAPVAMAAPASLPLPIASLQPSEAPAARPLMMTDTTLVAAGAVWKYLDNGTDQGTAWAGSAFDDSTWALGAAELGYGDGGEITVIKCNATVPANCSPENYITTYFRKTFNVPDKSLYSGLNLRLLRDDGAVVYLNGAEIWRTNMPTGAVAYNTTASVAISGADETTFVAPPASLANTLVNGTNVLAVEIHQNAVDSSDVSFNLELTAGLVCESFNAYTTGSRIGSYTGWFSDSVNGPVVTAANGVAGSTGLASGSAIFNWTTHPFNWNATDFQKIILQGDFKTGVSGTFDDDRLSWTINGTSTDSNNQFGVQLDHANGGIVTYWSNVIGGAKINDVIVPLIAGASGTPADTWYRFQAEITKLTATSARIDVNLVKLDASGNPTGTPYTGSIADTSALVSGHTPAAGYFTPTTMYPSYKNHTTAAAPADNTCYQAVSGAAPTCYALTLGHTGNGTTPTALPANSTGCSAGLYVAGQAINLIGAAADSGWQIASWYGTSNDSSTGSTNSLTMPAGTLSAGVNYSEMPVGNYALQFDGSTQYATFGTAGRDNLGLSTFTLELWFRRTGAGTTVTSGSGGVVAVPLLTKGRGEGDGSNIDMNYFLGIRASDNKLVADFEDMATGGNHPIAGVTAIPYASDAPWHHAAVTYDGTKWQLLLDGRLEAELTVGQTPRYDSIQYAALGAALNSCGQQSGGSRTGYTCPTVTDTGEFAGVLDEARIWNVARTQTEIISTMNSELSSGTGLIGRWGMNENSGTTIADSTAPVANGTLINRPVWVAGAPFNITPPAQYTLTVNKIGNGNVNLSPTGGAYYAGTVVQLTAAPDSGWTFSGWSGDLTGSTNPTTITMNANKTVMATFVEGGTVIFQEGVSSYAGTVDTHIRQLAPTVAYGTSATLEWDGEDGSAGQASAKLALLRFDNIFGSNAGQIPVGSTIASANLQYVVSNVTIDSPSSVNEVLVDWTEATTYSTFGPTAGVQAEDYGTLVATAPGASATTYTIDVTSSLAAWSSNPSSNRGWIIRPAGTDGVAIGSSENGTSANRPKLTVSYAAPPSTPPTAPSGLTADTPQANLVHLAWTDHANNESGFELERSITGIGGTYSLLTSLPANTITYDNTGLTAGQEYCYQVRAVNAAGQSTYAGPVCATPTSPEALDFGAGGAYVTFGDPPALDLAQFTIETWFKREGTGVVASTGSGGVTDAIPLVTKGRGEDDGSNVDMNYFLGIRASDNVLFADFEAMTACGSNPAGQNYPVIGTTPVSNGVWYHVAATFDGATWKLYLNGNLESTLVVNCQPRSDSIQHAGLGTALNSTGVSAGHFDGVLDEVHIWNYARTQAEIRSTINSQLTSAQTGLVARWALDDGGTAVAGSAGTTVNGTVSGTGYSWITPGAPYNLSFNESPDQPVLVQPLANATGVSTSPTLEVTVTDPESEAMDVTFYGRVAGTPAEDFTIIVLPDTQFYSESYPATFTAQTQWIKDNQDDLNIAYVVHEGDIVNVATTISQWTNADTAMDILDTTNIPYGVVPGNHDDSDGGTNYNTYFGVSRFTGKSFYRGEYPTGDNQNNYTFFTASGMDFIVINLDYTSPAAGSLDWADNLLKTNSTRRGIVVSHDIVLTGNPASFSTWGQSIYNALNDNPNLFLMMNGHTAGEGRRTDGAITSLLADYQTRPNGGNGWLRILEFSPDSDEIRVKTYSPTLGTYETDADSQFTLAYDMVGGAPFTLIGQKTGVASGFNASVTWPGLANATQYEWYVTVSDGTTTTTGPTWSFTSAPACYALTLGHTGNGSNPTATPANSDGCPVGQYVAGASISLSDAVPAGGWQIAGWTGTANDGSTADTNLLTMPASTHAAGVNYSQVCYTLTTTADPTSGGTISPNPAPNCNGTQYTYDTVVTLTATANEGYTFAGWSGDASGSTSPTNVTMDAARSVTADFSLNQYTLNVIKLGAGAGTVSSSPLGIACGATCSAAYDYNTNVTLTATPDIGSTFLGWAGSCSGTGSCVVTMSAARSVSATFAKIEYTLTVVSEHGTVTKTPDQATYHYGDVVTLSATADAGWTFTGWTPALTDNKVTINGDLVVTANYSRSEYTLTVSRVGNGTVSPGVGTHTYDVGAVVELTAIPDADWVFSGWMGDVDVSGTTVTMDADKSVTATFLEKPRITGLDLVQSVDKANWPPVPGSFSAGFSMALDPAQALYYLDVRNVVANKPLKAGQHPFKLNQTGLPVNWFSYWASQGVVEGATGWQGVMWEIINGRQPIFYLDVSAEPNYRLVDGLLFRLDGTVEYLRVNGNYPLGAYDYAGVIEDTAGVKNDVPVRMTFEAFPDTSITAWPLDPSSSSSASFGFSSGVSGASFECKLDAGTFSVCTSPVSYTALVDGSHTFQVRAKDANGNLDPTPATYAWTIDTNTPQITALELVQSTNKTTWTNVAGSLGGGFGMALDATVEYYYLDVRNVAANKTLTIGLHPFTVDQTDLPANWTSYWAAKGVSGSAAPGTWEAWMYQITTGAKPIFYLEVGFGPSYTLIDGLLKDYFGSTEYLRVSGDYPAATYKYNGVIEDTGGGSGSQSVQMTFTRIRFPLTVNKDGAGGGTVTSTSGGINCGTNCSAEYDQGTSVTLSALPDGASTFAGWSGACTGAAPCVVTMDAAKSVTASFARLQRTLNVSVVGNGSVTKLPDQATYDEGSSVQLTAAPAVGWAFSGWSGDLTGAANPESLTMNGDKSVVATFVRPPAPPTTPGPADGATGVSTPPSLKAFVSDPDGDPLAVSFFGRVKPSTSGASVFAVAAGEFTLIGSQSNVASGSEASVVWNGLTANTQYEWYATASDGLNTTTGATWSFTTQAPVCYALALGHGGQGSDPTAAPANSTGCPAGEYVAGESIALSGAAAASGWQIGGWTGTVDDASTAATNSVTMPASAHSATVNYTQVCYALTLGHTGLGLTPAVNPTKSAACASVGQYIAGEAISLSGAVPASGWKIAGWTGTSNNASTESTNSLTMPGDAWSAGVTYVDAPTIIGLDLVRSTDKSAWTNVAGSLPAGFTLALDPTNEFIYLDVRNLVSDMPLKSGLHPFTVDITRLPANWFSYWADRGVTSGAAAGSWQAWMYQIITGAEPIFYLEVATTPGHRLVDGLLKDYFATTEYLRVSGDYPLAAFRYNGLLEDAGGVTGSQAVWMTFDPIATTGLVDTTVIDLSAGTLSACNYVAEGADGELLLSPVIGSEFSGTAWPTAGWFATPWAAGGGATVGSGQLTVNGALVGTDASFGPGHSLEFVATFSASPGQHVGFGTDFNLPPWAIFSTGASGATLKARTDFFSPNVQETDLGMVYLGGAHRYRIDWTAATVTYYVDGSLVATHNIAIATDMRPLISDAAGDASLVLDWLHMSPYATTCDFVSRIFTVGDSVQWRDLIWNGSQPSGATVAFKTRSSVDIGIWEPWVTLGAEGRIASPAGRYFQYQATVTSADISTTPIVERVAISFRPVAPVVSVSINTSALTWPAVWPATGYQVYQSDQPYFTPSGSPPVETGTSHPLPGDTTDVYYLVRAVNGTIPSDHSGRVGRFTFALTKGTP